MTWLTPALTPSSYSFLAQPSPESTRITLTIDSSSQGFLLHPLNSWLGSPHSSGCVCGCTWRISRNSAPSSLEPWAPSQHPSHLSNCQVSQCEILSLLLHISVHLYDPKADINHSVMPAMSNHMYGLVCQALITPESFRVLNPLNFAPMADRMGIIRSIQSSEASCMCTADRPNVQTCMLCLLNLFGGHN